ncbi:MAG: PilZ domain-containing protein, partial [Pseudomonadales bacterium]
MSTDGDKATVSLAIKDRADLRDCYMPFVKNGGLFLAGKTEYSLGDQVDLLLELPDEPEPL